MWCFVMQMLGFGCLILGAIQKRTIIIQNICSSWPRVRCSDEYIWHWDIMEFWDASKRQKNVDGRRVYLTSPYLTLWTYQEWMAHNYSQTKTLPKINYITTEPPPRSIPTSEKTIWTTLHLKRQTKNVINAL